jgi:DNA repair protein RecO (recombination protein O)
VSTYRARCLSLKKTKLGEADLIVTLLASDGCRIQAVAKGARKTTSRFGARLEPNTVSDLLLARGRSLDIITEAEVVTRHDGVSALYERCAAASVAADFLDKASLECEGDERLFGLATATLDALEDAAAEVVPALVTAFLIKAAAMIGYRPQLGSCVDCGDDAEVPGVFSLEAGGVLCAECGSSAQPVRPLAAGVASAMSALFGARMSDVATLEIPPADVRSAFSLVRAFVAHHVPARLKALDLYASELSR